MCVLRTAVPAPDVAALAATLNAARCSLMELPSSQICWQSYLRGVIYLFQVTEAVLACEFVLFHRSFPSRSKPAVLSQRCAREERFGRLNLLLPALNDFPVEKLQGTGMHLHKAFPSSK